MPGKNPVDQLLDFCVYGPLGFFVVVRARYPQLVEQGRQQIEGHARLGRFAVQVARAKGMEEAGKALSRLRRADGAPATEADDDADDADHVAPPAPAPPPAAAVPGEDTADEVIPVRNLDAPGDDAPGALDELAIPAYDSLAASQVVQRLDGLTADELEAVRRYEEAHRSRRTVLGKIAQLQRHP